MRITVPLWGEGPSGQFAYFDDFVLKEGKSLVPLSPASDTSRIGGPLVQPAPMARQIKTAQSAKFTSCFPNGPVN